MLAYWSWEQCHDFFNCSLIMHCWNPFFWLMVCLVTDEWKQLRRTTDSNASFSMLVSTAIATASLVPWSQHCKSPHSHRWTGWPHSYLPCLNRIWWPSTCLLHLRSPNCYWYYVSLTFVLLVFRRWIDILLEHFCFIEYQLRSACLIQCLFICNFIWTRRYCACLCLQIVDSFEAWLFSEWIL